MRSLSSAPEQVIFKTLSNRSRTKPINIFTRLDQQISVIQSEVNQFNRTEKSVNTLLFQERPRMLPTAFLKTMTLPKQQHHLLTYEFTQEKKVSKTKLKDFSLMPSSINTSAHLSSRVNPEEPRQFSMLKSESVVLPMSEIKEKCMLQIGARSKSLRNKIERKKAMLLRQWQRIEQFRESKCYAAECFDRAGRNSRLQGVIAKIKSNRPLTCNARATQQSIE